MWAWYMRALGAHPLLTRTVTACVLTAAADVAAQAIERRGVVAPAPSWVPGRTLRLCAWSAAVTPVIALWFSALAALPTLPAELASPPLAFVWWRDNEVPRASRSLNHSSKT